VSNTSYFKVLKIEYHGGQRYPSLERVKGEKDVLEEILKPMAPGEKVRMEAQLAAMTIPNSLTASDGLYLRR